MEGEGYIGESGPETATDGGAPVVTVERESSAFENTFQLRDGKWMAAIDGKEQELSMPDQTLLREVLDLQVGQPPILRSNDSLNLAGDPVTFTAHYERTEEGIRTVFDEVPREVLQIQEEEGYIPVPEYQAPEMSSANQVASGPEPSVSFLPKQAAEKTVEKSAAKLWFDAKNSAEDESSSGPDIIDFFSQGRFFTEPTSATTPSGKEAESEQDFFFSSEPVNADLEAPASDDKEAPAAIDKEQDEPEDVEKSVLTGTDVAEKASIDPEPAADDEATSSEALRDLAEDEIDQLDLSHMNLKEEVSETPAVAEELRTDIALPESFTETTPVEQSEYRAQAVLEQVQSNDQEAGVSEFAAAVAEVTNLSANSAAPAELSSSKTDALAGAAPETVPSAIEVVATDTMVTTETIEPVIEIDDFKPLEEEPPAAIIPAQPEAAAFEPASVSEAEPVAPQTRLEVIAEPAPLETPSAEEFRPEAAGTQAEAALVAPDSEAEPTTSTRRTMDQAPAMQESASELTNFVNEEAPAGDEYSNIIRIEDDGGALLLSDDPSSWAADFGSAGQLQATQPELDEEPELETEPQVQIHRHESGLFDITVTFESDTPKSKSRPASRTMGKAA